MLTNVANLLWSIYQDIGRGDASMGMTESEKEDLVVTLREAADELEKQLKESVDAKAIDVGL